MELYTIPTVNKDFDVYQDKFYTIINENWKAWNIPDTELTKIANFHIQWGPAYKLQADEFTASKANKNARDTIKKGYTALMKSIIEQYILNKSIVPQEKKITLGIKTKKAPTSTQNESKGLPIIEIRFKTPLSHSIVFHDSLAPTKKAKPKGVAFCELRYKVVETGAAAPTSPDDFTNYELISASGGEVHFEDTQRGKTAHYFSRWRRTDGSTGPWSSFAVSGIIS